MTDQPWVTHLSYTHENGIHIRGYNLLDLIGVVPFPAVLYLLFMGEIPRPSMTRLLDAIMVASIDHGPGAPSALAARTAVSGGAPIGPAAAAGILTIGKYHGGAVEDSMTAIHRVVEFQSLSEQGAETLSRAADKVVDEYRKAGIRISGFGHRQHKTEDPRVKRLFKIAKEANIDGRFLEGALALSEALKRNLGKDLPINIDGAIAAILCEIDFPASLANALFMVARLVGILAHAHEELTTMQPMRRIDPVRHTYEGPINRTLEYFQSIGDRND